MAEAPHLIPTTSVGSVMFAVLLAMLPGMLAQVWQFGPGVLIQVVLAAATAELAEALVQRLRQRPVRFVLADGSALVTATLLAVSIPPLLPWGLTVFATVFALLIGKHLYGGLGQNPFNPAMVGYVILLISYPQALTQWPLPVDVAGAPLGFADAASAIFSHTLPSGIAVDAVTGATPLALLKAGLQADHEYARSHAGAVFGLFGAPGWEWVGLGYLAGGLWLWWRRLIAWPIPMSLLGVLFALTTFGYLLMPGSFPSPLFHLFSGGTMLGAFFVATDPVSAATTMTGRWLYGALIGLLVFVIRVFGGYPDAIGFAVLLMNLAAPTIDHWCVPGTAGRR